MIFLTQFQAGDDWFLPRFSAYFAANPHGSLIVTEDVNHVTHRRNGQSAIVLQNACPDALPQIASPRVSLIRNPIAVLLGTYRSMIAGQAPSGWHLQSQISAKLAEMSREDGLQLVWNNLSSSGTELQLSPSAKFNFCKPATASQLYMTVRVEDFAAFPVVTLRRICDFLGVQTNAGLVRAFMDRNPPRRKTNSVYFRTSKNTLGNEKLQPSSRLDLFGWADQLSGSLARQIYQTHQPYFATYYPEIANVLSESTHRRRVA